MATEVKVRKMQEADLSQVSEAIGRAFATNPNTLAVYGHRPHPERLMQVGFTARFRYFPGEFYVAEVDGRVVGGMRIVEWPNCQAPFSSTLKILPSMLKVMGTPGPLMRGMKILDTWKKHDPKRPHFHLEPLGVAPELQGKGVGSQLMKFYCEIIDNKGIEAYHETDRSENVPFYEKFGFRVAGEEIIIGARNWYLLRPAKSG